MVHDYSSWYKTCSRGLWIAILKVFFIQLEAQGILYRSPDLIFASQGLRQRFDKTWEEFIDINCNEELQDCDKLKIQILPGTH
jgi:hypothetical protein